MRNKKSQKKRIIQISIVIIALIIIIVAVFNITLARYESEANSKGNLEVALYLLNEDFKTMDINLGALEPRTEPYIYEFSIANNDGKDRTETSLEYTMNILATTNLPLTYQLYMNQSYTDIGATDILQTNEIITDEDGMYFRQMTTQTQTFTYEVDKINNYQLVVYFPEIYKDIKYQDIIENIEIQVNSRQII